MNETINRLFEELMEESRQEIMQQGVSQGISQGKPETLIILAQDGLLSTSEAAGRANMSEEEFTEKMEEFRLNTV